MKRIILLIVLSFFYLNFLHSSNYTDSLLNLLKHDKYDTTRVKHGNELCYYYLKKGHYDSALQYQNEILLLANKLNYLNGLFEGYTNLSTIYWRQDNYPKALSASFDALKLAEKSNNKRLKARGMASIGSIFWQSENYEKALNYFEQSIKIAEQINDSSLIALGYANMALVPFSKKEYTKALAYQEKALKLFIKLKNNYRIALAYANMGAVYGALDNPQKAFDNFISAEIYYAKNEEQATRATNLVNIGAVLTKLKRYSEAEEYIKQAISLDSVANQISHEKFDRDELSELYLEQKNYKAAFEQYKKARILEDTIFFRDRNKELEMKELSYNFQKKETEYEKNQAIAKAENQKQQAVIIVVIIGLIIVAALLVFIYNRWKIAQRQKNIIENQREKIIDSITYAQRIQNNILIEEEEIKKSFKDLFIYLKPKDIVSGDFYWFSKTENKIIIAAIDCTGHGVPGAFMSMIGNTLLNQIVNEKQITTPSEILNLLHLGIYKALNTKKQNTSSQDGMDIALCCIDYQLAQLEFAGARNPLFIIVNQTLEVINADKFSVGDIRVTKNSTNSIVQTYTNHIIPIRENMSIYMFSDGYMDQFGGIDGKKFGSAQFKELLLANSYLTMQQQKEELDKAYKNWKGAQAQIDDVLIVGLKIS